MKSDNFFPQRNSRLPKVIAASMIIVFALAMSIQFASAQGGPNRVRGQQPTRSTQTRRSGEPPDIRRPRPDPRAQTQHLQPSAALDNSGNVRTLESDPFNFSAGLTIGPFVPNTQASNAINYALLPTFAGINTPTWVSEAGPVQFGEDTILYGMVDVGKGLINDTPLTQPGVQFADLVIQNVTVPAQNSPTGAALAFSGTVANTGQADAPASITRLRVLQNGAPLAPPVDRPNATLAIALSTNRVENFSWTPAQAGTYAVEICADFGNNIPEGSGENNNCSQSAQFTVIAPQPDLIARAAVVTPAAPFVGDSVTLSASIRNVSQAPVAATTASLRILQNTNEIFRVTAPAPALTPNQTVQVQGSWPSAVAGNYTLEVCADSGNAITESDESTASNCATTTTFTVTNQPLPDLIASAPTLAPPAPVAGNTVSFTGTITNRGAAQATSAQQIQAAVTVTQTGQNPVSYTATHGAIAAAGTTTVSLQNQWTPAQGQYTTQLCADSTNLITEADETNNCTSTTVTVAAPNAPPPNVLNIIRRDGRESDPIVLNQDEQVIYYMTAATTVRSLNINSLNFYISAQDFDAAANRSVGRAVFTIEECDDQNVNCNSLDRQQPSNLTGGRHIVTFNLGGFSVGTRVQNFRITANMPCEINTSTVLADIRDRRGNLNIDISDPAATVNYDPGNPRGRVQACVAQIPDLIVRNLAISPAQPVGIATVTFTGQVANVGGGAAAQTSTQRQVSGQPADFVPTAALNPGGSSNQSFQAVVRPGNRFFTICADAVINQVPESNETNNCARLDFTVAQPPGPLPDLTIESITVPSTIGTGAAATFGARVRNNPAAAVTLQTNTTFRILQGTTQIEPPPNQGAWLSTGALSTSGFEDETISWTPTQSGNYTVEFCADNGDLVLESNEDNNCRPQDFTVSGAAALVVNRIDTGTTRTQLWNSAPADLQRQPIGIFNVTAQNTDVNIANLTIRPSPNSTQGTALQNISLRENGVTVVSNAQQTSRSTTQFVGIDQRIPAGVTRTYWIVADVACNSGTYDYVISRGDVNADINTVNITYPEVLAQSQPCAPSPLTIIREVASEPSTISQGTANTDQVLYQFTSAAGPGASINISQINFDLIGYANQLQGPVVLEEFFNNAWVARTSLTQSQIPGGGIRLQAGPTAALIQARSTASRWRIVTSLFCQPVISNSIDVKINSVANVTAQDTGGRQVTIQLTEPDRLKQVQACPAILRMTQIPSPSGTDVWGPTRTSWPFFTLRTEAPNLPVTLRSITIQQTTGSNYTPTNFRVLDGSVVVAGPVQNATTANGVTTVTLPFTTPLTISPQQTRMLRFEAEWGCARGVRPPINQADFIISNTANGTDIAAVDSNAAREEIPTPFVEQLKIHDDFTAICWGAPAGGWYFNCINLADDDCDYIGNLPNGQSQINSWCQEGRVFDTTRNSTIDVCRPRCDQMEYRSCFTAENNLGHCEWRWTSASGQQPVRISDGISGSCRTKRGW